MAKDEKNKIIEDAEKYYQGFSHEFFMAYVGNKVLTSEGINNVRKQYELLEQIRIENGLFESDYYHPPREIKELLEKHIKENKLEKKFIPSVKNKDLKGDFEHSNN
jgi:hypothetical protein